MNKFNDGTLRVAWRMIDRRINLRNFTHINSIMPNQTSYNSVTVRDRPILQLCRLIQQDETSLHLSFNKIADKTLLHKELKCL